MRERTRNGNDGTGGSQEPPAERTPDELDAELEQYVSATAPSLSKGDALLLLAKADADAKKLDERQLQDRYEVGESLVNFASRRGHVALGFRRLGPCLSQRFGLGRSWAGETLRCAKLATRDDLDGLYWAQVRLGMRLCSLLGVTSFEALKKKPLPVPSRDGEAVFFPAPVELLEKAIELLEKKPPKQAEKEEEARATERAAHRKGQAILDEHLEKYPALAEAKPVVYVHDGTAQIRIAAVELRAETLGAVAKLFAALDRTLNRA